MAIFQGISLPFIMLMIISTVKGRWLRLDTGHTPMISDGVHDTSYGNPVNLRLGLSNSSVSPTMLYAEKKCNSIYGFLPCADTMPEGVFLMFMYIYLMMLGEEWIHKGSEALFVLLSNQAFGASIFRVLMALPRIVIVVVSGILSTESDAQNQVAFGVGMYAGSTVISLTLIWGFHVILRRDKLRGKGSTPKVDHREDSSSKCLPLKQKLSVLTETGVNIDKETGDIAVVMLLSLIPFAIVELVQIIRSPTMILFPLIASGASLLSYFAYQILHPWLRFRSLAYLKQENLRKRLFYHAQMLVEDDLIDQEGNPNFEALESLFRTFDKDKDGRISQDELEHLIQNEFRLEEDQISKEYAKAEILTHFDSDESGKINWLEFKNGCTEWLKNWKNISNNSNSVAKNLWKLVEKRAIKDKLADLSKIEKLMPRILRQVHDQHELVTEDGEPDREKIEGLFSKYDKDGDDQIHPNELKQFIKTVHFGLPLDYDDVLEEVSNDLGKGNDGMIQKEDFVDGFARWIKKAINDNLSIKDPSEAIKKFEQDIWAEVDSHKKKEKPRPRIMYAVFGVGLIIVISGAFIQSVIQFSNAARIPFPLTAFVMAPIAMNARTVISAIFNPGPRISKNASLTFSELYSGLVMNNLLGLSTLLVIVVVKGLSWSYSADVLTIMITCAIVGLFAFRRRTYPLWASISAMLLYPISICLYYVMES